MPATEARAIEGLTTGQAARLLGLSEQSTRALVRRGEHRPARGFGRI